MEKLTFKEYLDSKERLKQAIKESPVRTVTYKMKKYCKFPIGESKDDKEFISLKPNHVIIVEWEYTSVDNPEARSVRFENVGEYNPDDEFVPYWNNKKLEKWLIKSTTELQK